MTWPPKWEQVGTYPATDRDLAATLREGWHVVLVHDGPVSKWALLCYGKICAVRPHRHEVLAEAKVRGLCVAYEGLCPCVNGGRCHYRTGA